MTLLTCAISAGLALTLVLSAPALAGDRVHRAQENYRALFGDELPQLAQTDPDLFEMKTRLIYGEIKAKSTLTPELRSLISLVAITAGGVLDEVPSQTAAALKAGATPVQIREAIYQCAPYVGFPRAEKAAAMASQVFLDQGLELPESQKTVTEENRLERGILVQTAIFGDAIPAMREGAPQDLKALQDYLSAYCFGDIYTRGALDLKAREILTFCAISALGGCESQVTAHVEGNRAVGNSRQDLIDALMQCLPYMGFPRTLNALNCVNAQMPASAQ